MAEAPTPSSRLDRDDIIAVALRIADRDGLDSVSMHRLARELGVGTMTLYTYVDGKEDLLDGMADHVLSLIELPVDGEWDERIRAAILATRDVAERHPSLAELIMTRAPATDVKRERHDHTTEQLLRGGLSEDDAAHAAQMLWGLIGGLLLGKRTGVFTAAELVVGRNRPAAESRCDVEFAVDVALDGLRLRAEAQSKSGIRRRVM
jgi:AcrR family transcriptional regulator